MITLIYGAKGSGKTNQIIQSANDLVAKCDGELVFLTDTDKYRFSINYNVRLINVTDYDVASAAELSGFIRGIVAGNADVTHIYVDGVHRMTKTSFAEMEAFFAELGKISTEHKVDLVLTVSSAELPAYMQQFDVVHA